MRLVGFLGIVLLAAGVAGAAQPNEELSPQRIKQRIAQHRTAEASVTVLDAQGRPLANADVVVRQVRHKFLFGCNAFRINTAEDTEAQKLYQQRFSELLNFATLGFYWGSYERSEGQPAVERLKMMATWCQQNDIRAKGHPLCWQQVAPPWLMNKPQEQIERLQLARVTREVSEFAGLVDTWDVVNEAVVMPTYKQEQTPIPAWAKAIGPVEVIQRTFAKARAANPKATLLLNDFDTSPKYERLIQDCLDGGVSIDVIGIQSHMHAGYWGPAKTWEVCQRFAKLGKPLHFTEATIISAEPKKGQRWNGPRYEDWASTPEGEQRQAQQVAEFYTILFSHPAVEAITWWDFSDDRAWLGAPSGLVRKDMSPKPAYEALKKLIKGEWWTAEVKATTDAQGKIVFRGFLGDYALESAAGKARFALEKAGSCQATAKLADK